MKRRKGATEQSPFHCAVGSRSVRTIPPSVKGRQSERNESIDRRVILLCPFEYASSFYDWLRADNQSDVGKAISMEDQMMKCRCDGHGRN
jgi:hypothetical protein